MHRGNTRFLLLVLSVACTVLGDNDNLSHNSNTKVGDHHIQQPTGTIAESTSDSNLQQTDSRMNSAQSVNKDSEQGSKVISKVESSLLKMFGLNSRPIPPKDKLEIPQYMIDLYKEAAGVDHVDLNLNNRQRAIRRYPGNTIRSYYHEGLDHEVSSTIHKTRLYFNLSHLPQDESLEGTELRIYRHRANDSAVYPQVIDSNTNNKSSSINKPHRINIYDVIKPKTSNSEAITRLIDTKWVYPHKSKWESFDIRPALFKWRQSPHLNHGLEVHYTDSEGNQPELGHVRLRRSLHSAASDWTTQQPVLIVYSDDGKDKHFREKRNADRQSRKKKKSKEQREAAKEKKKRKNHCKRHPLFVDFLSVGWTDWIIAPAGYEAYFCHGECPFYMPDHLNATNHAIVQNMVNSFNPQAAPKPCCVPTELSAIAMLYLNDVGKVVLKTYQEMVVDACGCR